MSSTRRSSLQLSGRKKSQDKHTGLYQVARLEHSELACVPPQVPSHSMAAGPESSKVHPQTKLLKLYITCELNCLFNKADVVECRQVSWPKLSESTSAPIFFGSEFSLSPTPNIKNCISIIYNYFQDSVSGFWGPFPCCVLDISRGLEKAKRIDYGYNMATINTLPERKVIWEARIIRPPNTKCMRYFLYQIMYRKYVRRQQWTSS